MNRILIVLLLVVSVSAVAVQPGPPPPPPGGAVALPEAPPPPPAIQSGQVLEPGVTIIQTESETIYEYRAGPHLYMVRVVPKAGPPYYFYDQNGDGQVDYSENDPRQSSINQWVIFRW